MKKKFIFGTFDLGDLDLWSSDPKIYRVYLQDECVDQVWRW